MAKTNATFKFGKMNKIKLGSITDPMERSIFKRAMIDAQASYIASKNRKYTELKSSPQGHTPKAAN
jgi:hypothetical protein